MHFSMGLASAFSVKPGERVQC